MCEKLCIDTELHVPDRATILCVDTLSATEKLFRVRKDDGTALGHLPGQFVMLTVPNVGVAPISVTSSPTDYGYFELGVRAVSGGNVTPALHARKVGDTVFVSRPCGNGFPLMDLVGQDLILVAGGIGLFPLRSLIRYVREYREFFGKVAILFGAKNPSERLLPLEIDEWEADPTIEFLETVDKGDETWKGNVGLITTLFAKLSDVDASRTRAVVIGPDIMFKFVSIELQKLGLTKENIYASTERKMSCGLGLCRNCLLPNGKRACVDGPVFSMKELNL